MALYPSHASALFCLALLSFIHSSLQTSIGVSHASPLPLSNAGIAPLCVTTARNASAASDDTTTFIVVYGEVLVASSNGKTHIYIYIYIYVIYEKCGRSLLDTDSYWVIGVNSSQSVERHMQVFNGDALRLVFDAVDTSPGMNID